MGLCVSVYVRTLLLKQHICTGIEGNSTEMIPVNAASSDEGETMRRKRQIRKMAKI